jgi:hypothetical protein
MAVKTGGFQQGTVAYIALEAGLLLTVDDLIVLLVLCCQYCVASIELPVLCC